MSELSEAIAYIKKSVIDGDINPTEGLPEELFLLASSLVPIVNIDLFVTNERHEVLLSWRSDLHHGKGWHIPGGCVRMKETLSVRVKKTALDELGTLVIYNPQPILVREGINDTYRPGLENQLERSHGISFLYECRLPDGYNMPDEYKGTRFSWFNSIPDNLLDVHKRLYGDYLQKWFQLEE